MSICRYENFKSPKDTVGLILWPRNGSDVSDGNHPGTTEEVWVKTGKRGREGHEVGVTGAKGPSPEPCTTREMDVS